MAANSEEYVEPTYGNWRIPARAGIGRLSGLTTALVFASLLLTIIVLKLGGLLEGFVTAMICALVIAGLSYKDKYGYSILERLIERAIFMFGKRTQKNVYRSGPLGMNKLGTYRLPGIASSCTTYEAQDTYGRNFTLVHMPAVGVYSVAIAVEPDGAALVDQPDVDQWVANWGGFLAELGREVGLIGAAATVETSPGSGLKIRKEIESTISPEATPIAQLMLAQAAETYPTGVSQTRSWITLSFSAASRPGAKKRKPREMLRELSSKIPFWCSHLESTGAGTATPLRMNELAEIIRIAYDPATARIFEDAYYRTEDISIDFDNIGPSATLTEWDYYRHYSGVSTCWTMTEAPRGSIFSNVLQHLLAPHQSIDRKRVTVIYRPIDSARTADIVEKDQNTARTRATSTRNASERVLADLAAANATAQEEARGAGLSYFGLLVAATVEDASRLNEAIAVVEQELAPTSRIMLRRAYGAHDAVFAATLPLGIVLGRHALLPESIKSAL